MLPYYMNAIGVHKVGPKAEHESLTKRRALLRGALCRTEYATKAPRVRVLSFVTDSLELAGLAANV